MAPRTPLLLVLAIAACKTAPPAKGPASASSCVVAVMLRTRPDREPHNGTPRTAYFVKLAEDGDALSEPVLLRSNFSADGVLCLLDAEPGRYAAVACYGKGEGRQWTAYFPEELIRASEKRVPEGKALLLGSFDVDLRSITTTADAAQRHYFHILFPDWEKRKEGLKLFTRDEHAWGGPWVDAGDEKKTLRRMKAALGPAWKGHFE